MQRSYGERNAVVFCSTPQLNTGANMRIVTLAVLLTGIVGFSSTAHAGQHLQPLPVRAADGSPIWITLNDNGELLKAEGWSYGVRHTLSVVRGQDVHWDKKTGKADHHFFITKTTFQENGKAVMTFSSSMDSRGIIFMKAVGNEHEELSYQINLTEIRRGSLIWVSRTLIDHGKVTFNTTSWNGVDQLGTGGLPIFDVGNVFRNNHANQLAYFAPLLSGINAVYKAEGIATTGNMQLVSPSNATPLMNTITTAPPTPPQDTDPSTRHVWGPVLRAIAWGLGGVAAYAVGAGEAASAFGMAVSFTIGADASLASDAFSNWENSTDVGSSGVPTPSDMGIPSEDEGSPPSSANEHYDDSCGAESTGSGICSGDVDETSSAEGDYGSGGQDSPWGSDEGGGWDPSGGCLDPKPTVLEINNGCHVD